MPNENDVILDSSLEQVVDNSEVVKTPETTPDKKIEKVVPYSRFKSVNDELAALKAKPVQVVNSSLDVNDYIEISASLEGLDAREKEYLAKQHKVTGQPLNEIRKSEDFGFWQSSYQGKKSRDQASLTPSTKQPDDTSPISLEEALNNASTIEEKEAILAQVGYSVGKQSSAATRVKIG